MQELKNFLIDKFKLSTVIKIVFNTPVYKSNENFKIVFENKGDFYQMATFYEQKVKHTNYDNINAVVEEFMAQFEVGYKQIDIVTTEQEIKILSNKKKNYKIIEKNKKSNFEATGHNRQKQYILNEGENIQWLVKTGVMTENFKVIDKKYKKFKQINKFLEIIRDVEDNIEENGTIIDFGCGKSYLTFAIYHYLNIIKNKNVKIIGLDLKKDVIENCNKLAKELRYENLTFLNEDISNFKHDGNVTMVVTLHACDTATDLALYNAIKWNSKVILSAPCCQHEIYQQIKNNKNDILLKYGIISERLATLITDSIRATMLESKGYETNIIEFIEMEHTPKNVLIRGVFTGGNSEQSVHKAIMEYKEIADKYNINQSLYKLLYE